MGLMEDEQVPQSAGGEAKVITLCGSTTFEAEFAEVNQRLTMEGCVVMSLGMFSLPDLPDDDWTADRSDLKRRLGEVHFQKIRMADEVPAVRIPLTQRMTMHHQHETVANKRCHGDVNPGDHGGTLREHALSCRGRTSSPA